MPQTPREAAPALSWTREAEGRVFLARSSGATEDAFGAGAARGPRYGTAS